MSSARPRGACHLESSEGDDRTTDRPTGKYGFWNGTGKERREGKTKTAAKKKFIAERQDKRGRKEGGREGRRGIGADQTTLCTRRAICGGLRKEGNRVRSFVRPSSL